MIDAATTKPAAFDVILVHSFSRFFRDQFQLEFYVRRLAKNGVRLVSITQELGDDPMSNNDPPDHGAVRRIPIQGERQAHAAGDEGERAPRLLEWRAAADRLPHRRSRRAARPPHEEDAGDRSHPGRDCAADLSPSARRKRLIRIDGRKIDCQASERIRHPNARRRALGRALKTFVSQARKRMRTESGGYRRDHLRALAQRIEVDAKEVRIMGSKSMLLRTLVAASGAKTAGFGVPSSVPKWRARNDSNVRPSDS